MQMTLRNYPQGHSLICPMLNKLGRTFYFNITINSLFECEEVGNEREMTLWIKRMLKAMIAK